MTADELEAKKQDLLDKLLACSLKETGDTACRLKKLEELHKRINAIERYQQEHKDLPVPVPVPVPAK